jgi:hypothetical protein
MAICLIFAVLSYKFENENIKLSMLMDILDIAYKLINWKY